VSDTTGAATLRPLDVPRSLAEDAADRIREQILAGGFAQGEHLVEARIAGQLKVSRGPVREAFKLLRSEGLLLEEPRRGTFVVSLVADDVREIYSLRAAIEGRAARLLAGRKDPAAIAELKALLSSIEAAAEAGDVTSVYRHDLAFHDAVCRLSGNARLHEVFARYVPMLRALLHVDERMQGSLTEVAEQHRPIVDAIERGDVDAATKHAEHHCDHAGDLIAAYLESLPDLKEEDR
jgi:GntR family transcriptional regulator, gluconate operon transcriptional repressor